jgi:hypothetical protein
MGSNGFVRPRAHLASMTSTRASVWQFPREGHGA